MGDPLDPDRDNAHPSIAPGREHEYDLWVTEHGVLWASYDERNAFKMESERTWPPLGNESGRQAVEEFLRELGIPASVERSIVYEVRHAQGSGVRSAEYRVSQSFQGRAFGTPVMQGWVAEPGAGLHGGFDSRFVSGFDLRRIHDLSSADVAITPQNATERAVAFFECARNHSGVGEPDPGFSVAFDSLAFEVMVLRGSEGCGRTGEGVLVDARTGAILGFSGGRMSVECSGSTMSA